MYSYKEILLQILNATSYIIYTPILSKENGTEWWSLIAYVGESVRLMH